jgi:type II secretory pathway component PulK
MTWKHLIVVLVVIVVAVVIVVGVLSSCGRHHNREPRGATLATR